MIVLLIVWLTMCVVAASEASLRYGDLMFFVVFALGLYLASLVIGFIDSR